MNICRHCKTNEGTMVDCRNTSSNGTVHVYYSCKECNNKRARDYRKTEKGKDVYYDIMSRQYQKHKHKISARNKLHMATKRGLIAKPTLCDVCGLYGKLDGHHDDYDKPLEVRWLCRNCHNTIHINS